MTQTELFPQRAIEHNAYVPPMAKNPDFCYGVIYMAITPSRNAYIGQSTQFARRKKLHYLHAKKGATQFDKALRKYGDKIWWQIIWHCDSQNDLDKAEKFFIAYYRKHIKHPHRCYNHTTGGGGGSPDAATRAKIGAKNRGRKNSAVAEANRGRIVSVEQRAKISAANKGHKYNTSEVRAKISAANKGKKRAPFSAQTRANMSKGAKNRKPATPQARKNMSVAQKGRKVSPEHREKIRQTLKGRKLSLEHRANISVGQTGSKHSPQTLAKMSAAQKMRWANQKDSKSNPRQKIIL